MIAKPLFSERSHPTVMIPGQMSLSGKEALTSETQVAVIDVIGNSILVLPCLQIPLCLPTFRFAIVRENQTSSSYHNH